MDDDRHPVVRVIGFIDLVGFVFRAAVLLAVAIAFLVMGHTAGRLVGIGLLALLIFLIRRELRRFAKPS